MAAAPPISRPWGCWNSITRYREHSGARCRYLTTYHQNIPASQIKLPPPGTFDPQAPHVNRKIKCIPPFRSAAQIYKHPMEDFDSAQIRLLDPTGARTALFSKTNSEGVKVGDILLVRSRTGNPFAGVCINIRRRGVETGILLRNQLTRVAVEMWFKVYSPNVTGIEMVQRRGRRPRRARLTYMRKPKHDVGSVQRAVASYESMRRAGDVGPAVGSRANMKKMGKGKNLEKNVKK